MSNAGIALVAESIGQMGQLNSQNQFITCNQAVDDISAYCTLTAAWSSTLDSDENQCFVDTLSISPQNPWMAAKAAQDHAQFTADSTAMQKQTGTLTTQIQQLEASLQREGNFMETVYTLANPLNSLEGATNHLLTQRM